MSAGVRPRRIELPLTGEMLTDFARLPPGTRLTWRQLLDRLRAFVAEFEQGYEWSVYGVTAQVHSAR